MAKDESCKECDEPHFYGGQAVIEGVMMRGPNKYAVAVRRTDGEVVVAEKQIPSFAERFPWARWPLLRGNVGLVDSLVFGFAGLQFSADVLTEEERERTRAAAAEKAGDADAAQGEAAPETPASEGAREAKGLGGALTLVTTLFSGVVAVGLFIVLPTLLVDWMLGKSQEGAAYSDSVVRNLVEGGIRLTIMMLYIVAISLMQYVKRVFQYHGAEHATINCLEDGGPMTPDNCLRHSPLHPRCGTAFLLVVILVKIVVGCFFGWPPPLVRSFIRIALLPLVAGIAYEVVRWAGRHRNSLFSRVLAAPGMLMQVLTTRKPDESQVQVAMYALAAVAPEVQLPEDWPMARRLPIPLSGQLEELPGLPSEAAAASED
jgi:uncharacterized protein YqhQ